MYATRENSRASFAKSFRDLRTINSGNARFWPDTAFLQPHRVQHGTKRPRPGQGKRIKNRRCASGVDKSADARVSTIRSINISLDMISRGPLFHLASFTRLALLPPPRRFFSQLTPGHVSPRSSSRSLDIVAPEYRLEILS